MLNKPGFASVFYYRDGKMILWFALENDVHILIDNYFDETVLSMLSKLKSGVQATIFTSKSTKQIKPDLQKHNQQYPEMELITFTKSHDRFLIIDKDIVYHIGASRKTLAKKIA